MKSTYRIMACNNKGGVGKTTISINLAAALTEMEKTVIFIDLDDSTNSTSHLKADGSLEKAFPVSSLISDESIDIADCILWNTRLVGLGLIPSDRMLKKTIEKYVKGDDEKRVELALRLNSKLKGLDGHVDYVIIDTSPSMDSAVLIGLMNATHVYGVIDGSYYSEMGLVNMMQNSDMELVRKHNPDQKFMGVIANKIGTNTRSEKRTELREDVSLNLPMTGVIIPQAQEINNNTHHFDLATRKGRNTRLAKSYRELAKHIIQNVKMEA